MEPVFKENKRLALEGRSQSSQLEGLAALHWVQAEAFVKPV